MPKLLAATGAGKPERILPLPAKNFAACRTAQPQWQLGELQANLDEVKAHEKEARTLLNRMMSAGNERATKK